MKVTLELINRKGLTSDIVEKMIEMSEQQSSEWKELFRMLPDEIAFKYSKAKSVIMKKRIDLEYSRMTPREIEIKHLRGFQYVAHHAEGLTGHILENTKSTLPDGSFDPDLSITYSGDVMSFVNGTANLVELPAGTKLYRVCNDGNGAFTGGYWTRTKPNNLDEVIGGTAVQPEWNSFNNVVEYTVPNGQKIWVWEGNAASQKLSNNLNLSNPHLAGGGEQILIPLKYRRVKKPDGAFDFGGIEQSFLDNIIPLSNSQIPWK